MKILACLIVMLMLAGCNEVQTETEYDQLVKIADMQAVRIAIIEQGSKLTIYRQQIAAAQEAKEEVE